MRGEGAREGGHQARLADGGGGLFLFEAALVRRAERGAAEGDGAGGDEDDFLAALAQRCDVSGEVRQPLTARRARLGDQGRAGFHDDAFGAREGVSGHGAGRYTRRRGLARGLDGV